MPPVTSHANMLSAAHAAVSKQVDALSERIRLLKTRHNALLPISTLPAEILASIFIILATVDQPGPGDLGWIKATHVCQAWRDATINNPLLWQRVERHLGARWVEEITSRARGLPLDMTSPDPSSPTATSSQSFPRASYLSLELQSNSKALRKTLRAPAPTLVELSIFQRRKSGQLWTKLELPDDFVLFGGNAPELRHVDLNQVFIPWKHLAHYSLTSLDVVTPEEEGFGSPLSHLFSVLGNCPGLVHLVLDGCIDEPASRRSLANLPIVHLEELRYLSLGGATMDVRDVLQGLEISHSASLRLVCRGWDRDKSDPNLILPLIFERFCKPDSRPFQSLSLMTPYLDIDEAFTEVAMRRTLLDETNFESSWRFYDAHRESDAELNIMFKAFDFQRFFSVLSLLISKLPLDLRCLHVNVDDVAPMDWMELFGRCNKVTTLNVIGRHGFELLELMADGKNDTSSGGNHGSEDDGGSTHGSDASNISPSVRTMGRPLFPQLRRLLAHELNFKKPTPLAPSTPIEYFETILGQRNQRGSPVERLCVTALRTTLLFFSLFPFWYDTRLVLALRRSSRLLVPLRRIASLTPRASFTTNRIPVFVLCKPLCTI
ncbi:hypothetical protein BC834DRAFT_1045719 [Gloeopeniophorella convolvens]|nr:hypothetical protein BC834DRAFT_1045719 [Gloeopeniophorella convolvens]